jgi:hypothetical protein
VHGPPIQRPWTADAWTEFKCHPSQLAASCIEPCRCPSWCRRPARVTAPRRAVGVAVALARRHAPITTVGRLVQRPALNWRSKPDAERAAARRPVLNPEQDHNAICRTSERPTITVSAKPTGPLPQLWVGSRGRAATPAWARSLRSARFASWTQEQLSDRILHSHENKTTAEVHDYLDERTGVLAAMLAKRARLHRSRLPRPAQARTHSQRQRRHLTGSARHINIIVM